MTDEQLERLENALERGFERVAEAIEVSAVDNSYLVGLDPNLIQLVPTLKDIVNALEKRQVELNSPLIRRGKK